MKYILLCTALFLLFDFSFLSPIRSAQNLEDVKSIQIYLDKFFPSFHKSGSRTLVERLKEMQIFFNLTVTGKMDAATKKLMGQPRCGMPDQQDPEAAPQIWPKKALTYRINNYTLDLHRSNVQHIIKYAFNVWSDVTPLTFTRVHGPADIEILFAYGEHGDGHPFDGIGKVLAHASFPGPGIGGDAHFDESEKWSETNRGKIVLEVIYKYTLASALDQLSTLPCTLSYTDLYSDDTVRVLSRRRAPSVHYYFFIADFHLTYKWPSKTLAKNNNAVEHLKSFA